MQFNPGDYARDTASLNLEQHGAYLLLIMEYFNSGKSLKEDKIPHILRINRIVFQRKIRPFIQHFFYIIDDDWFHKRVEKDLQRIEDKSKSAKKSVSGRWGKSDTNVSSNVIPRARVLEPEPEKKESKKEVRAPKVETEEMKLRVAICDAYLAAGAGIPPQTGEVAVWLSQGFPADLCLSVVRSKLPAAKDKGLRWFDKAIAEAFAKRPQKPPDVGRKIEIGSMYPMPENNLRRAVEKWRENPQSWAPQWGDPPNENSRIKRWLTEVGETMTAKNPEFT
jgi:uncharacterized protein YdaU (DUF1376 family)